MIKLKKCVHPHFCYEWDSMFITPLMPEFKACLCQCSSRKDLKNMIFDLLTDAEQKRFDKWKKSK